jgi:hypothetical protein
MVRVDRAFGAGCRLRRARYCRRVQGGEAFANAGNSKQPTRSAQVAATAVKQATGKMLFERTDMSADRALGNRQFFGRTGKRAMPRRRFECSKGIQGRKTTRHQESSYSAIASTYRKLSHMSFNHATHPFYPFVQTAQSAENRCFPVPFDNRA